MNEITDELEVILESYQPPKRSRIAEGKFRRHRDERLAAAGNTATRLEVARLSFRADLVGRDRMGLTREELADRSGVSVSTIERAEKGKPISDDSWRRLAIALADPKLGDTSRVWGIINPGALRLGR